MTFPVLNGRIEAQEPGGRVFADTALHGRILRILHVEADPALRGTGAAGRFMQALSEQARAEGLKLHPICGYARAWLMRSTDFRDLIASPS